MSKGIKFENLVTIYWDNFFYAVNEKIMSEWRADSSPRPISGTFLSGDTSGIPNFLRFDDTSLQTEKTNEATHFRLSNGTLFQTKSNKNFTEYVKGFKQGDFEAISGRLVDATAGKEGGIVTGQDLAPFFMISFFDLKKYIYKMLCGFPFVSIKVHKPPVREKLDESLRDALKNFRVKSRRDIAFILGIDTDTQELIYEADLNQYAALSSKGVKLFLGVVNYSNSVHVSVPTYFKNVLAFASNNPGISLSECRFLMYKENRSRGLIDLDNSYILRFEGEGDVSVRGAVKMNFETVKKKSKPKVIDKSSELSPQKLALKGARLNLELMKWRLIPNLDLDKISSTKVGIFGLGSRGSQIARGLISWGFTSFFLRDPRTTKSLAGQSARWFISDEDVKEDIPLDQAISKNMRSVNPGINSAVMEDKDIKNLDIAFVCVDHSNRLAVLNELNRAEVNWFEILYKGKSRHEFVVVRSIDGEIYPLGDGDETDPEKMPTGLPMASALCVELAVAVLHAKRGFKTPHFSRGDRVSYSSPFGFVPQCLEINSATMKIVTKKIRDN